MKGSHAVTPDNPDAIPGPRVFVVCRLKETLRVAPQSPWQNLGVDSGALRLQDSLVSAQTAQCRIGKPWAVLHVRFSGVTEVIGCFLFRLFMASHIQALLRSTCRKGRKTVDRSRRGPLP
jgi:hypothetical protein